MEAGILDNLCHPSSWRKTVKTSKQERRRRALARFRVLPFKEWVSESTLQFNGKLIGVAATQQEMLDAHEKYCERKAVERAALEASR